MNEKKERKRQEEGVLNAGITIPQSSARINDKGPHAEACGPSFFGLCDLSLPDQAPVVFAAESAAAAPSVAAAGGGPARTGAGTLFCTGLIDCR